MTIPAYHMHFLFFPRPMVIIKSAFFQKCPRDHRCTNLVRVDSVPGDVGGMAVLEVIVKNGLQVDEAAAVFFRPSHDRYSIVCCDALRYDFCFSAGVLV